MKPIRWDYIEWDSTILICEAVFFFSKDFKSRFFKLFSGARIHLLNAWIDSSLFIEINFILKWNSVETIYLLCVILKFSRIIKGWGSIVGCLGWLTIICDFSWQRFPNLWWWIWILYDHILLIKGILFIIKLFFTIRAVYFLEFRIHTDLSWYFTLEALVFIWQIWDCIAFLAGGLSRSDRKCCWLSI